MADDVIRASAENDDQIGFAERVVAHREISVGVVVREDAAPLRGRVEHNRGKSACRRSDSCRLAHRHAQARQIKLAMFHAPQVI